MVVAVGEPVALIAYPGEEQLAALRLARVGSDNVVGYLTVERGGAFPAELADLVQPGRRTTARKLAELLADDNVTLIDGAQSGRAGTRCHPRLAPYTVGAAANPSRRGADRPARSRALRGRVALECGRVAAARQRL